MKNEIWNMINQIWNMEYPNWNMEYEKWNMKYEISKCTRMLQSALEYFKML